MECEPPADDTLEKILAELRSLVGLDYVKRQLLFLSNFARVDRIGELDDSELASIEVEDFKQSEF